MLVLKSEPGPSKPKLDAELVYRTLLSFDSAFSVPFREPLLLPLRATKQ